jgi:hypothetical protein
MSDTVRGLVLLVSLLLWLPVLRPLLAGELSTTQAGVRYAGALAIAWGGASLLSKVVASYTPDPPDAPDAPGAPDVESSTRRQEDVSS